MNTNQVVDKLKLTGVDVVCYNSFTIIIKEPNYNKFEHSNGLKLLKLHNGKIDAIEQGFSNFSMNNHFTFIVDTYGRLHYGIYIKDLNTNILGKFKSLTVKGFTGSISIAHKVGIQDSKVILVETPSKNFLLNYKGNRLDLPKYSKSESRNLGMMAIISKDNCNTYSIGFGHRDPAAIVGMVEPVSKLDTKIITVDSELNILTKG